ncbi:MAG: AAA family ATPase, partial [Myxococcales bacterium]|nr:AAA family ATPase [Myxococcales bacterium]
IHRDLKGSNVLVTSQDRVVVLDFGLVNELERRTAITSAFGRIEGTVLYMSPEQTAGRSATAASDWYAVGVMLYRAVTGRYPLSGSPWQLIDAKQTTEAPRTAHVEPGVPPDLDELIARLLLREPDRRGTGLDALAWCEHEAVRAARPAQRAPRPLRTLGLIGRERELQLLDGALSRFLSRVPLRVDIVGAAGTGKTALLRQFVMMLRQRTDFAVFEGHCHEHDTVPFKALDGLIDTLGRHLARRPPAEIEPLLVDGFEALTRLFPTLRQLRDMSGPQVLFERLGLVEAVVDPQMLRRRALQALRGILHRLAISSRLVLVVDELQWGDLDSAQLLDELMAPPGAPPLMFLCAYRSEHSERSPMLRELTESLARTGQHHEVVTVDTRPLKREDAAELANRLLGDGPQHAARAQAIAFESQGNPMLITAMVRQLGDVDELDTSTEGTIAGRRLSALLGLAERARTSAEARRFRREAVEHLLTCGRRSEALAVLEPLMNELSLTFPASERTALMRMKDAFARLSTSSLRWVKRSAAQPPSRAVEHYELSWSLCKGLVLTDSVRGGLFAAECALLALELGEPRALARSLALAGAIALERRIPEGGAWLAAAGELAEHIGDDAAVGFVAICWGLVQRARGSWLDALGNIDFGLGCLPAGAAWEHSLAADSQLACLEALGEVASLRSLSLQISEFGKDIGSTHMLGLGLVHGAVSALAAGDIPRCRALLAEARAMDHGGEIGVVQLYCFKVEVECELWAGDPAAAWHRVESGWEVLARSRLLEAEQQRFVALSVRARAGLALVASGAGPRHVLDVVAQDITRLGRESSEYATPAVHLLQAGLAELRGEGRIDDLLRTAAAGFDVLGMALHAICTRLIVAFRARMAAVDDVLRAEALMRLQGIAEPRRWARMLVPGVRV